MSIFILGFLQFYTILFFSRYFEYIYLTSYDQLVIFVLQLVGIWTCIWQGWISRFRNFLYPLSLVALVFLSRSQLGTSIFWIASVSAFLVMFLQSEILYLYNKDSALIHRRYSLELIGGFFGVLAWIFFFAELGFQRFFLAFALLSLFIYWQQVTKKLFFILHLFVFILCTWQLQEPQPIVAKRDRYAMLEAGSLLGLNWDPNGHVELLQSPMVGKDKIISFNGGSLRSSIVHFDGDLNQLRSLYLASDAPGFSNLDVALPFLIKEGQKTKAALISCVGGQEALAAKAFNVEKAYAIDINSSALRIAMENGNYSFGNLFSGNTIQVHRDGRNFMQNSNETFDVIQIFSAGSTAFSSALGSYFIPSNLVTTEAFQLYEERLASGGILHISNQHFNRTIDTFSEVFGLSVLVQHQSILAFSNQPAQANQASILYKKGGWSKEEISRAKKWLNADRKSQWNFLVDPSLSQTEYAKSIQSILQSERRYHAVSDNWPFLRIFSSPFGLAPFLILFGSFLALGCFIFGMLMNERNREFFPSQVFSFGTGISFSMAQCLLIFFFQKSVGLPNVGFGLAMATMLLIAAASARVSMKFSNRLVVFVPILFLATIPFADLNSASLIILSVFQGLFFVQLLRKSGFILNKVFFWNGLGFTFGIMLFNVTLILFGLWQAQIVLVMIYGMIFYLQKKCVT